MVNQKMIRWLLLGALLPLLAHSRGPFYREVPHPSGKPQPLVFDLDPSTAKPTDLRATARAFAVQHSLDEGTALGLEAWVEGQSKELGILPAVWLHLTSTEGLYYPMAYHHGDSVQEMSLRAGRDLGLREDKILGLGATLEDSLIQAGIGRGRLVFPSGYVQIPDRNINLFRRFCRIKIVYPINILSDKQIEAMAYGLASLEREGGPKLPWELVTEVEEHDYNSLYIITPRPLRIPRYYIAVQIEQLDFDPITERYMIFLKGALEVWEYSSINMATLAAQGIRARLVPFGYGPTMEIRSQIRAAARPADVIFFGGMTDRRRGSIPAVHRAVSEAGLRMDICEADCYGDDRYFARIALNVHSRQEGSALEVHRIIPLIANKVWVISERSNDTWLDSQLESLVDFVPLSDIAARALAVARLQPAALEAELEARYMRLVQSWSMQGLMRAAGALEFVAERVGPGPGLELCPELPLRQRALSFERRSFGEGRWMARLDPVAAAEGAAQKWSGIAAGMRSD